MRGRLVLAARYWVPIAVAVTAMCMLTYLVAQQQLRMSLNDPQIQLAQDVAQRLVEGAEPKAIVGGRAVDIAASLAPWVQLYDANGKPVYGQARLEGTVTAPPKGVFAATKATGEDRVTWQPRPDVRVATVVEYWRNAKASGFVVAGRNMREIEDRISQLGTLVFAAWVATLLGTLVAAVLLVPAPGSRTRFESNDGSATPAEDYE